MLSDQDVEVLEAVAKDGTMEYERWPDLVEPFLEQLYHTVHHEFPIPTVRSNSFETITTAPLPSTHALQDLNSQANSNKENAPPSQLQSPPRRPSGFPSSSPASSMRIPDSQPQSSPTEGALPQSLQFMLSSIESTLKRSFSSRPPHTIQRLAELILRPTRHYRTLPAYLRALDRVVSVSSGADIFPLPLAVPPSVTVDGSLSNGVNGAGTSFSLFNDSSLGSDESLGGALLTPIPWLSNATPPPSNEDWPPQPGTSADILSAGTSAQNEASSQEENPIETKPDTTDAQHPPRDEKIPHARGPSIIGVEDMGLQDGNDVQMTLLASEPAEVSTQNQLASEEKEGEKSASASLEEDGDGDIVIGDVSAASEAQSSTTTATPSNEATKTEPAEADSAGDERKGIASDDPGE